MATNTVNVTGTLVAPNGTTLTSGSVVFQLSDYDLEAGTSEVITGKTVEAVVSATGTIDVDLWPNLAGERGTVYIVTLVRDTITGTVRESLGVIQIPDTASTDLSTLLDSPDIVPPSFWTRLDLTTEEALVAAAAADAAEDFAAAAATSAGASALSAGEAEASAIAAGAAIFADTTAGLAGTVSGNLFFVPANGGLDVYENVSGVATYSDTLAQPRFAVLSTFTAAVAAGYDPQPGTVLSVAGVVYERVTGAVSVTGLPGWVRRFDAADVTPQGPDSPAALLGAARSDFEAQAAVGNNPRRVFISAAGTHIINAADYAPALHLLIIPTSTTATLDCAGLVFNAPYEFINAQPSTTVTLDFGEDVYIRSPDISPGITTVRTLSLPPNNRVTVIRIGGNQVFVDYASPPVESGTWTPIFYGSTTPGTQAYSLQQARWLRFGDLVTLNAEIRLSSTSGAAGNLRIGGAPFTALGNNNDLYPMVVPYQLNFTSNIKGGSIEGGTDYISLWTESAGDSAALNASELENASRIRIGGSYMI